MSRPQFPIDFELQEGLPELGSERLVRVGRQHVTEDMVGSQFLITGVAQQLIHHGMTRNGEYQPAGKPVSQLARTTHDHELMYVTGVDDFLVYFSAHCTPRLIEYVGLKAGISIEPFYETLPTAG